MTELSDFTHSINEAVRTLNKPRSLDDTLQTIVEVACNSVPGFDQVGISTVEKGGVIITRACTGDLVLALDRVQYELGEGPCSATLQGDETVSVSSLGREQRWPRYVAQALELGLRSQLAVKLYIDHDTLGGINFYSTLHDEVDADARELAQLFATHAAIALGHAQEREDFSEALRSRRAIGQAIGLLMERFDMTEDRSFGFLVRASSHRNIKLAARCSGVGRRVERQGRNQRASGSAPCRCDTQIRLVETAATATTRLRIPMMTGGVEDPGLGWVTFYFRPRASGPLEMSSSQRPGRSYGPQRPSVVREEAHPGPAPIRP